MHLYNGFIITQKFYNKIKLIVSYSFPGSTKNDENLYEALQYNLIHDACLMHLFFCHRKQDQVMSTKNSQETWAYGSNYFYWKIISLCRQLK